MSPAEVHDHEGGRVPGRLAAPDGVQVWFARLPDRPLGPDERTALAAGIDAGTLERLARFTRAADRDRGLVGHGLLRRLLAAVTGDDPAGIRLRTWCPSCGSGEHGKPFLPGERLQFNLSHSGGLVGVALAAPGLDVGVDVESRDRTVDWVALRRSVFADEEWDLTGRCPDPAAARTDLWSRKEAAGKATGHGLARSLRTVRVIGGAGPEQTGGDDAWSGVSGDPAAGGDQLLGWDVAARAGVADAYAAAVAVRIRSARSRPWVPDVRVVRFETLAV